MLSDDGASRGRLLTESSTRAFANLRTRAMTSLARLRTVALTAFAAVTAVFAGLGDPESRTYLLPLLLYALGSYLVFRPVQKGRAVRQTLAMASPILDVAFVFLLLWTGTARTNSPQFNAGWALGVFSLLVGLSSLSMRKRIITATAGLSLVLLAALHLRAGVGWANLASSAVVLLLVAMASTAVVRELERMLARLVVNEVSHEELRHAQSEAETLTHLLVHDMKGPLTGLIGLAEVVASEITGRLKDDVKMIEQQGRRLQSMVGDLLAIARLERGVLSSPPEQVDLSALLISLANAYGVSARQAGAQIKAAVEPGLTAVLHREMIHRFFDNLVLNALDFVRAGGRIEVAAWQEGPDLVLAVRNTGEPVPLQARERLFQKHAGSRAGSRGHHNLGLGLYLCRLVALAHDGSIGLAEEPDWAASFVARLPVEARRISFDLIPRVSRAGT
ncbi:MAG TPA: HAMP domain-containing sensor histidine kinase [Myxococcales bacterium]|jgi:signal transduction histidine kinase|nr:HAMP domain-containing sensor histidine kinase [Myxococcales bacterium]